MTETGVRGRTNAGRLAVGVVLVALGVIWLLAEVTDLDLSDWWPLLVMAPGFVFLAAAAAAVSGGRRRTGLLVTAFQLLGLGGLLWFQVVTELWTTWAYAWALLWPGSIGLAVWIGGRLAGDDASAKRGRRAAFVGFVMFLVGFVFFEAIIGISGGPIADIGDFVLPLGLILLGALLAAPALRRLR